jgi:hypothetical protein
MQRKSVLLLSVLALVLGATSCQQLPPQPPMAKGLLQTENIAYTDAIPLDYGTLVGVTALPDYPYTAALWFEKADKTIVLVKVNVALGKIEKTALLLPRR